MKNFLVVILGIVWVIFGLYSSKMKKEKVKQQNNKPGASEKITIEDIFERLRKGKPLETFEEGNWQERENLSLEDLDFNEVEKKADKGEIFETEQTFSNKSKGLEKDIIVLEEKEQEELEFDLRQAIIYSEIINKKYI